jgi:ABC-2 type transport system permease protein
MGRYVRLFLAFARIGLAQEMSFRANFLIKLSVEALWLAILLLFYNLLFNQMDGSAKGAAGDGAGGIAGWDRYRYLFFVGCFYSLSGLLESFFLENCTNFTELVRSGDLDVYLLQPIDEQFILSLQRIDWSTLPNVLGGAGVMAYSLAAMHWTFDPLKLLAFLLLMGCGTALAYSFLLMLCCTAIWMVRNQSLLEMWWLFTTLMRYPREVFLGPTAPAWAWPIGWFFTLVVPVLLVVSVPADLMVRTFEPWFVVLMVTASVVMLAVSRWFFRKALRSYRSASS